jgi:peptidyl-prolyl cis-trans isomerase B (cyclophilin B)
MRSRLLTLPAVLALAAGLAACGSDDGTTTPTADCTYDADGQQPAKQADPPSSEAPASGETTVTLATSEGDIEATLDQQATPCAAHSFVSLAEQGYFDDTTCHRLTTQGIFVLQCGDPTATGGGGPGYSFEDELDGREQYPAGTIAMANAGPDTNGSQFFLVYEDTELPPSYTTFGTIDDAGLDVVREVADAGVQGGGPDGPPATEVTIESASVG